MTKLMYKDKNYSGGINKSELVDMMFPVGSIYMSVKSANPSTYLGGTWEAWGAGRVPVGVDTSDTNFGTVEETGGEKTHTLTKNEMPSHEHGNASGYSSKVYSNSGSGVNAISWGNAFVGEDSIINTAYNHHHQSIGGGAAHNNLQPYITCYMWKRTA